MMRIVFISVTVFFWLALAGIWINANWFPSTKEIATPHTDVKTVNRAVLAKHASPSDCWMAIYGYIYDLSNYLPDHPSRPEIIQPRSGKEATDAYNTKTEGRPHSRNADELLKRYQIGTLDEKSD